jgi:hypothetical protein
MFKNWGFSVKESGVGGSLLVVPMANWGFGGEVGRRERIWLLMERSSRCKYLQEISTLRSSQSKLAYNMRTSFERRYGSPTDLSG